MKKVVFLRVERGSPESSCQSSHAHQSALVLRKSSDGYLSIQGRSPVAWSERQRCWELFRKAAKSLLGVCEASAVSVCFSDPPYTAINDLVDVFRQPSHIVSLTLSPLPDLSSTTYQEVQRRKNSRATSKNCTRQPISGLYEHGSSPLSSPQAKRRPKMSGKEIDKLLSQLDEVSQSLERTQTQCEAIARRCKGRVKEPGEDTDGTSDADCRVEQLLKKAETLTNQIITGKSHAPVGGAATSQQPVVSLSETGAGLPDSPTGVCAQPNLCGGTYILWNPVRLDGKDRNNGCKVIGYAVYIDGVRRLKVNNPIGSHVVVMGMESGTQYQIQVSTLAEGSESPLPSSLSYRHEAHTSSTVPQPPSSAAPPVPSSPTDIASLREQHSAKVENWLLGSSQTVSTKSQAINTLRENEGHTGFTEFPDGVIRRSKSERLQTTPPDSTHLTDDTQSMGSSHTSGIVMDHPPSSPKLTHSFPSYNCDAYSVHSDTTTLIVDGHSNRESFISPYHHHHLRLSPSPTPSPFVTPSRARSPTPQDHTVDTEIDEPLDFNQEDKKMNASSTVHLVARSHQQGPAPPTNIRVRSRQPGYISVSWSPTRVYINGTSRISVDSPMSYETMIRCPHLDSGHRLAIHVRTRSIAAESEPSSTAIYDLLLQETLEQSLGPKVISSTVTLCPSDKPHPRPLHKPSSSGTPTASHETYV